MPVSKYRNQPTVVDGIRFDSKAEASRYCSLKLQKLAGVIKDFRRQVKYVFEYRGIKIGSYVADFTVEHNDGRIDVEDVKGVQTPVFRLKSKMMKAFYGVDIKLINVKK